MRYKAVGEKPPDRCVAICVPHTSNVDFLLMIAVAWTLDLKLSFLGKDSLFKPPMGRFMRFCGGIPVDRANPAGLVDNLASEFAATDELVLAVPAEGTRGYRDNWKSGFYRISQKAEVPISMAFIDAATRTTGFGPWFDPTGDIAKDMDRIREFYDGKVGLKPENQSKIYLKEENPEPGEATG